jgi:tetratricopeptide (TPR) repeat protein
MIRCRSAILRLFAGALAATWLASAGMAAATDATERPEIDLKSLSGMYLAARIADSAKDISQAATFYRAAHARDPQNLFLLERALVLTAAEGNIEQAEHFAKLLVKDVPDSRVARLVLAASKLRGKTYAAARTELERSGDGMLADLTKALLSAWISAGQGQADGALAELDSLTGQDWYEPFKLLHGGYIAAAAEQNDEALRRLGQAYESDRGAVRIAEAYARMLAQAGQKARAEEVLEEFLSRYPRNPLAQAALARVRSGEPVRPAVRNPVQGAAEALSGLGAAIGQEGGLELGILYLRLALYLEPQLAGGMAAVSLGTILESNNLGEEAIAVYESVAAEAPFRPMAMLRAAVTRDQLDEIEAAESAFQEAIARDPEDIQTYLAYGNMLRGRERFDEAAEIYSEAIARVPEPTRGDWTLFYFRGIAHERTKAWPKAEADFQTALELYPDQPLILNYLGYSWVDMGMHLEEALEMIKTAVELRPNDGYIVDSLGWAYYKLGRYEEAVEELERAVSLRPEDPIINDHLGDAYWKVGRHLEAQFQWRHARDLGAEEPELEIINRKISTGRLWEKDSDEEPAADAETDRRATGTPPAPAAAPATKGKRKLLASAA